MKRYVRWISAAFVLFIIFGLTFQNGSASKQLTEVTQSVICTVNNSSIEDNTWWNDYIFMRKAGHFVEYIPLGISVYIAFKQRFLRSFGFCMTISLIDQLIKGVLPGREFDWSDMPYDMAGCAIGIAILMVGMKIIKSKRELS